MTATDFQSHVDELGAIRQSYGAQGERIAADASLSPAGRQALLARVWLAVAARLDAETAVFDRRVAERKQTLERELYAPPDGCVRGRLPRRVGSGGAL